MRIKISGVKVRACLKCLSARFVIDISITEMKRKLVISGLKCLSARFVIDIGKVAGLGDFDGGGSQMPFG